MDQLTEVDVVAFVTGNTERYVVSGDRARCDVRRSGCRADLATLDW